MQAWQRQAALCARGCLGAVMKIERTDANCPDAIYQGERVARSATSTSSRSTRRISATAVTVVDAVVRIVIDPQRDIDRVHEILDERG